MKKIYRKHLKCALMGTANHQKQKEMFPVEAMINEILAEFKGELVDFFAAAGRSLEEAETYFTQRLGKIVTSLLGSYYEQLDRALLEDKKGRREEGMRVERRADKREVLTFLGEVQYTRTYYQTKEGKYCYPIDQVAGVSPRERLSESVQQALVENACKVSYRKSCEIVTGRLISAQSVMNKVRSSSVPVQEKQEKQKVKVLHIDADEDHVTLRNGRGTIVPLISIYEGFVEKGKRRECKNIFHVSAYGVKTEELWEKALCLAEERYDLSEAKIYLHGDGAAWIQSGLEHFPRSEFVLDPYHKNKAIRQATGSMEKEERKTYQERLYQVFRAGDREEFNKIYAELLAKNGEQNEKAGKALAYLNTHFDAIYIRYRDPEAANGGATEPHISHVLSARLSSRPMAWSKATLEHLAPVLAAGRVCMGNVEDPVLPTPLRRLCKPKKKKAAPSSLGLADPDQAVSIPAASGKVTPLFNALRGIIAA